jgi:hypothetical protein
MSRDAEQRLIASVMLLVAGLATVGWYAWLATVTGPSGPLSLFVLGSVAVVVLSVPAGPLAFVLSDRRERDWAMAARTVTLLLVLGTVAATLSVLVGATGSTTTVAGTGLGLVAFWVVVPLAIGAISATTAGPSMLSVVVAWPATNLLALATFVAPTPDGGIGFGRYNATFLNEPVRTIVLLAVAVVVVLGPTLVGTIVDRYVYGGSPDGD